MSVTTDPRSSSSSATYRLSDADREWLLARPEPARTAIAHEMGVSLDALRLTAEADPVNHPAHYAGRWSNGAEVIDITENLNFNRGNAVKYLARAGTKDAGRELEDLRKAAWYVQREITRVESQS